MLMKKVFASRKAEKAPKAVTYREYKKKSSKESYHTTVRLDEDIYNWAKRLGDDNISAGLRRIGRILSILERKDIDIENVDTEHSRGDPY